jgi:hypothetical protein
MSMQAIVHSCCMLNNKACIWHAELALSERSKRHSWKCRQHLLQHGRMQVPRLMTQCIHADLKILTSCCRWRLIGSVYAGCQCAADADSEACFAYFIGQFTNRFSRCLLALCRCCCRLVPIARRMGAAAATPHQISRSLTGAVDDRHRPSTAPHAG